MPEIYTSEEQRPDRVCSLLGSDKGTMALLHMPGTYAVASVEGMTCEVSLLWNAEKEMITVCKGQEKSYQPQRVFGFSSCLDSDGDLVPAT